VAVWITESEKDAFLTSMTNQSQGGTVPSSQIALAKMSLETLEIQGRAALAEERAAIASEKAANASVKNAKYMLWSVIAAATSAIAALASTIFALGHHQ